MNFITSAALATARFRVSKMKDYHEMEEIISKRKGRAVKLTKEDVIAVQKYAWFAIYSEVFILGIILILAALIKIFIPTSIILTAFIVSRIILKGQHLNSFEKCSIFTISYLLGFSYLSTIVLPENTNILLRIVYYAIIGFVLEVISLTKGFKKILDKINRIKIG